MLRNAKARRGDVAAMHQVGCGYDVASCGFHSFRRLAHGEPRVHRVVDHEHTRTMHQLVVPAVQAEAAAEFTFFACAGSCSANTAGRPSSNALHWATISPPVAGTRSMSTLNRFTIPASNCVSRSTRAVSTKCTSFATQPLP